MPRPTTSPGAARAESTLPGAAPAESTPRRLIGRQAELTELIDRSVSSSEPTITLLSGDAGTGKTRLLQEVGVKASAAGGLSLFGSCVQVGDFGLPYLPIIDALRAVEADPDGAQVLQQEAAVRPALARLLPQLVGGPAPTAPGSDGLAQGQLFEALRRVLTALAETRPVLLVIEDVHWADRSTRDLIAFLARTLRTGRIAVIASYRSDDLHRRHPLRPLLAEMARLPHVRRINLGPLGRDEVAQLLEQLSGAPVDPQLLERVFARSEGNAFFAEELARARAGGPPGRLPDELVDVLLSRVEDLGPAGREAVRAAAVAGRRVGHDLLLAAAGTPDIEDGLREAVEAGLMISDGDTYAFRHALYQEAVYGDLLPGERVRRHARFAQVLADGVDPSVGPAERAHHLLASHDLPGALRASVDAAAAAEAMAAPAEALRHLEQAVSLLDRVGDAGGRLDLLRRAAEAASNSGDTARAMAFGSAAVTEADACGADVMVRAQVRERLARLAFEADQSGDRPSREALELLPDATALRARALATRARAMFDGKSLEMAAEMLAEAVRIAEQTGADMIAADALVTLSLMARRGLLPAAGAPAMIDALPMTTGPEGLDIRVRTLRFLSAQLMEDGDLEGAFAAAQEGVDLTDRAGLVWSSYGLDLRLMRGWVLAATGDWDQVLADSLAAVYAPTEPGRVLATQAVGVLVGRGDPEAERLLARLRGTGDHYAELQLDLAEVDQRLLQGRPAEALALARACAAQLVEDGWGTEKLLLAARQAAALADLATGAGKGRSEPGADLAEQARALADEMDAVPLTPASSGPLGRSWRLRLRAEADRANGADTAGQWLQVRTAAVDAGRVPDQAYAGIHAARLLLSGGERDRAADLLRVAEAQASQLGAAPMLEQIAELARRGRLDLRPTAAVQPTGSPLTARETEVLTLVATGRSNRQVGQELFISDKTASVHLSRVMAKLGAATRTEAVALARQRGLLP
ncbi:helix-turn-helix transcriptional regulator [Nakamurella panacisegetis]|uniref:helix-turn-helix transcriptional regulator n=1 Tax=Nakamurella panacisegetis TaxID=1090615 RepID=UPI001560C27D|nr:helix-turn-helix transcriptional regulator [Nakamurella panacisegetis]